MRETFEERLAKYFINEQQRSGKDSSNLNLLFELYKLGSMKGIDVLEFLQVTRGQRWRRLKMLKHIGVIAQYRDPGFAGRELNVKLSKRGKKVVQLIKAWEPNLEMKPIRKVKKLKLPKEQKEIKPDDFYDDFDAVILDDLISEPSGVEQSGKLTKKQRFELEKFLE